MEYLTDIFHVNFYMFNSFLILDFIGILICALIIVNIYRPSKFFKDIQNVYFYHILSRYLFIKKNYCFPVLCNEYIWTLQWVLITKKLQRNLSNWNYWFRIPHKIKFIALNNILLWNFVFYFANFISCY